ncbi:UDP-galactopyranose mutase [Kiritimatiellaeota bacterium B1221]|nr:UDP-galactopyranose mutase [Kiritimatiellaeota bacterium B1221]
MSDKPFLIVGAGFSGAVLARELAIAGYTVNVIDQRDHIAGNCHTQRDPSTGVMVHQYGPHIFNTSNQEVWDYINQFGKILPFINRVKASIDQGVFSLPINLHTINQFFDKKLTPSEAGTFVETLADLSISDPQNFEEQALRFMGRELYEAFFYGYTKKQWGVEPSELPASILKRLPIRFNYDDNYYNKKYQGIPEQGYSAIMGNILNHPNISVELGRTYTAQMAHAHAHVFYTGPIDQFFEYREGKLGYRTVYWEKEEGEGDLQGNAVINYPDEKVPYTRKHEHKHFAPWETHKKSVLFTEYSKETESGDIPYYPKRLEQDKQVLDKYIELAQQQNRVSFLGRLATYRYMDMEKVIAEALAFSRATVKAQKTGERLPTFPEIT